MHFTTPRKVILERFNTPGLKFLNIPKILTRLKLNFAQIFLATEKPEARGGDPKLHCHISGVGTFKTQLAAYVQYDMF